MEDPFGVEAMYVVVIAKEMQSARLRSIAESHIALAAKRSVNPLVNGSGVTNQSQIGIEVPVEAPAPCRQAAMILFETFSQLSPTVDFSILRPSRRAALESR